MTTYRVYVPIALKIYEVGVNSLLNVPWIENLFQKMIEKDLLSGNCPKGVFEKTLPKGLLSYLGGIFFDMLFNVRDDASFIDDVDEIQETINFLILMFYVAGLDFTEKEHPFRESLWNLVLTYDEIEDILNKFSGDSKIIEFRKRQLQDQIYEVVSEIMEVYPKEIKDLRNLYASNFAERVFHDREFCEYISYAVAAVYEESGFPTLNSDEITWCSQMKREKFPSWVLTTLRARERDKCASCGKSISELLGEFHIDHIVPLSKLGFNDIVNLQLLCQDCNVAKTNNLEKVEGSIPKYFTWRKSMM